MAHTTSSCGRCMVAAYIVVFADKRMLEASRHAARGDATAEREGRMINTNCIELLLMLATRLALCNVGGIARGRTPVT